MLKPAAEVAKILIDFSLAAHIQTINFHLQRKGAYRVWMSVLECKFTKMMKQWNGIK
jgi:hypothetical protein